MSLKTHFLFTNNIEIVRLKLGDKHMKNKTIKEKIAQMFLVGIPNKESIEGVLNLINNYKIGGVILYKNNYENLEELKGLIKKLKEANKNNELPLTIAIDQEGGRVNRLPNEFIKPVSLFRMAKNKNEDIKTYANITSSLLNTLGINMNFAPVLDLKKHHDNHAIGNRAISNDVNRVTEVANIICEEYKNNNVIPVIKHFPGQGSVTMDSHVFLPTILNYKKILKEDSVPFKKMIDNGIDAIMVGHILILGHTNLNPASISKKFIRNELRDRYKYKNIIMTDELGMRSVSWLYGKNRSIIKAFKAENDIVCCKYSDKYIENLINKIEILIRLGKLKEDCINSSYKKIETMKKENNFTDEIHFKNLKIEEYNKNIEKLNEQVINL